MAVAEGCRADVWRSLGAGSITGLVGVPVLFTVITEVCVAALAFTLQLGAASTSCSYYRITAKYHIRSIKHSFY